MKNQAQIGVSEFKHSTKPPSKAEPYTKKQPKKKYRPPKSPHNTTQYLIEYHKHDPQESIDLEGTMLGTKFNFYFKEFTP